MSSVWIGDTEIILTGTLVRYALVAPECYELVRDPESLARGIVKQGHHVDLLIYGQRLPDIAPKHRHYMEWDEIAALRVTTYDHWITKQIIKENKKNIAKAEKRGISVAEASYDDDFVAGIVDIYNESPIRQGKAFTHYRKDPETVRRENGTYPDRSLFIGAYWEGRLIGFVKLFLTSGCASTMQVISKIEHRDKKPTNALLAKAVEICSARGIPFLQYGGWSDGTLGDFKRYNGFERMQIPLYYVPASMKGRIVLRLKLHHGIKQIMPDAAWTAMKNVRKRITDFRYAFPGDRGGSSS
jgi:hypothetical protein